MRLAKRRRTPCQPGITAWLIDGSLRTKAQGCDKVAFMGGERTAASLAVIVI